MEDPSVVAEHLDAGYFDSAVLHDINFSLHEKGIYVVLGHNGAGKTMLFRTIAGILSPLKGRVILNGSDGGHRINWLSYLTHGRNTGRNARIRSTGFLCRSAGLNAGRCAEGGAVAWHFGPDEQVVQSAQRGTEKKGCACTFITEEDSCKHTR